MNYFITILSCLLFLFPINLAFSKESVTSPLTEEEKLKCFAQAKNLYEKSQIFLNNMRMAKANFLLTKEEGEKILTKWGHTAGLMEQTMNTPKVETCRAIIPKMLNNMQKVLELKNTLLDWGTQDPLMRVLAMTLVHVFNWIEDEDLKNMVIENQAFKDEDKLSYYVNVISSIKEKPYSKEEQSIKQTHIEQSLLNYDRELKKQEIVRLIATKTIEIFKLP